MTPSVVDAKDWNLGVILMNILSATPYRLRPRPELWLRIFRMPAPAAANSFSTSRLRCSSP